MELTLSNKHEHMDHNNTGMCKHCTHVHVPHSHHVGTRTYMHITSGICTQIVAAVKVALMPLYEMIPVLVSGREGRRAGGRNRGRQE